MKVIADIGSNWITLDDCLKSVEICNESNIDIVKFQYFTHEKLYGFPGEMKGELPKEWIPQIAEHAKGLGVEFMCSVFDPDDVEFLDQYVFMHKIASSENNYQDLIKAVEECNRPYLVSMGCRTNIEFSYLSHTMACIAEYPTGTYPIEQLTTLANKINGINNTPYFGLSDHNPSEYGYELAHRFGCSFYEFHFNPLKIEGPDTLHSRTTFEKKEIKPHEVKYGRIPFRPKPKVD